MKKNIIRKAVNLDTSWLFLLYLHLCVKQSLTEYISSRLPLNLLASRPPELECIVVAKLCNSSLLLFCKACVVGGCKPPLSLHYHWQPSTKTEQGTTGWCKTISVTFWHVVTWIHKSCFSAFSELQFHFLTSGCSSCCTDAWGFLTRPALCSFRSAVEASCQNEDETMETIEAAEALLNMDSPGCFLDDKRTSECLRLHKVVKASGLFSAWSWFIRCAEWHCNCQCVWFSYSHL